MQAHRHPLQVPGVGPGPRLERPRLVAHQEVEYVEAEPHVPPHPAHQRHRGGRGGQGQRPLQARPVARPSGGGGHGGSLPGAAAPPECKRRGSASPPARPGAPRHGPARAPEEPGAASPAGMRSFLVVWAGRRVSVAGTALRIRPPGPGGLQTGSVTRPALVSLAYALPAVLLSPLAGVMVDPRRPPPRHARRRPTGRGRHPGHRPALLHRLPGDVAHLPVERARGDRQHHPGAGPEWRPCRCWPPRSTWAGPTAS